MNKGVSRNTSHKMFVSTNIDELIEYVDDLKYEIYKALVKKVSLKILDCQKKFIYSPLVKYLAFVKKVKIFDLLLNPFDIGYYILFFNIETELGFIFLGMSEKCSFKKQFINLVNQIQSLMSLWVIEVYNNYLVYINNSLIFTYYRSYCIDDLVHQIDYSLTNGITIDLSGCKYSIDIMYVLNNLNIIIPIKNYFQKIHSQQLFIKSMDLIDSVKKLSIFRVYQVSLVSRIIDLFMLICSYHVSLMYSLNSNLFNCISYPLTITHDVFNFLVTCRDRRKLNLWIRYLNKFLQGYNVNTSSDNIIQLKFVYEGIHFMHYFIYSNYLLSSYILTIRPSLQYQQILLYQISIVIVRSKEKPLFLLMLRLNKLLLTWFGYYISSKAKKNFVFLDYLIYLKLKLLIRNQAVILCRKDVIIQKLIKNLLFNKNRIRVSNLIIRTIIISTNFYRQYYVLKLAWFLKHKN